MRKLATLTAAALMAGALGITGASAQTALRLSVETPEGEPLNYMLRAFAAALEETSPGAFEVEIFDGGVLGDEIAQMELVRAGQVDVVPMGSDVVEIDNHFALFDAPFFFADAATARTALDGELGDMFAESLEERTGLKLLAFGELGFRMITNNVRPVVVPADLDGLKLRTPGSSTRIMAFETLGAAPTPMNLGEAYLAMQQGVLDGQENPFGTIREMSFHEVQKYLSLSRHVYTPITLVMNARTFDGLSAEEQEAVMAAAAMAREASRAQSDENTANLLGEFEAAGMEVNEIDLAAFKEATPPIYEEIGTIVGPDFMDKATAIVGGN
ncbi:TRAP transporter substrate-binding protein [Acuticoccus yangtzensis]|uniref:TRAP transporter substrate-binding protein n=1 Tax=Acuticoccus yangtzensis TaxID=1443441 RepID=UPI000949957C|nr:TRAP transporter substrate-binding protein [Acuticoccus yangtzensis]